MNGRMYDTDLRRFLSPDNYVQDPTNTQNYNRYQYGYNNPLKYSDPSGEFFFLAAIIIGAIVGGASYAVNAAITGKWSWGGFFKAIVMGGVSGAISFGIGSWTASMKGILSTVVNISAHAVASGAESLVQGGKFLAGALAGGISAGIAKGVSALTSAAKRMSTFVKSAITIASGGVSGGIGSALGGGKFIDGFRQGVITVGLNHVAHEIEGNIYAKRVAKQQAIARLRVTCERVMAQGNATLYIETDGIGHAYVKVNGTVFSYGRYNGSYSPASGRFGLAGDGVLLKYSGTEAQEFINYRMARFPTNVYTINNIDANKVYNAFNNAYLSGNSLAQGGRVINTYYLFGSNCVTTVINALNAGGAGIPIFQTPFGLNGFFDKITRMQNGWNPGALQFGEPKF